MASVIRFFFLSAVVFLLIVLTACGEAADTSGLSGSYILHSSSDGDIKLQDSLSQSVGFRIRLDPGGGGKVTGSDSEGSLRWGISDDRITIFIGDTCLTGEVEGSSLILQPKGTELQLRFDPEEETSEEEMSSPDSAVLSEDWYGWWKIDNSEKDMPVSWYDCCACFQVQADGTILFVIWDEDGSLEEPLGEILFEETDAHLLSSIHGYFLYQAVSEGDWLLSVSSRELLIENLLHDAENESFLFSIYLRPWGSDWKDLEKEKWPFYYEDWYLPLIDENSPMPDAIPWQELEKNREFPID